MAAPRFVIVVVVLLELLLVQLLASGQEADNCDKLVSSNYTLFGDQTLYETAQAHLAKDTTYLPNSWSFGSRSLEQEHKRLVEDLKCRPSGLFYVGRHAASYPHHEQIKELNESLLELQRRLKEKKRHKCGEKVRAFLEWRPSLQMHQADLVTPRGAQEQRRIVKRYKRLYPELFNAHKSEIRLGVTEAVKTAQTAGEFLAEIENWKYEGCDLSEIVGLGAHEEAEEQEEPQSNRCYRKLIDQNRLHHQLEYDKLCLQWGSREPLDDPIMEHIERPVVAKRMARRVSDRLRLRIDEDTLASIYEMCAQETNAALNGKANGGPDESGRDDGGGSVWCSLFTERELKQLEYVRDAVSFTTGAYGPNVRARQSCPLIRDILGSFEELLRANRGVDKRRRSYFYFSQASHFEKLLADLGLFHDERSYTENKLAAFLSSKAKVPLKRDWRSSLMVSHSAHLALALYECGRGKEQANKLLASVSERPVQLDGCKGVVCSMEDFTATYGDMRNNCNLEEICSEKKEEKEEEGTKRKKKKKEEKPKKDTKDNNNDNNINKRPPPYVRRKDGTLTVIYS